MQKCQDTKLKNFGKCKKDALKTGAASPGEIETACLTTIDDGDKCGTDMAKKCASTDNDALFPGCAGEALAACLDQKVECEVCRVLNALDGLARDCDEFDDGETNSSCGFIQAACTFDSELFCVGGSNNTLPCTDWVFHSDCPGGLCEHTEHTALAYLDGELFDINDIALSGGFEMTCGPIDLLTGTGTCTCRLSEPILVDIPGITAACLTPGTHDCGSGTIDCQGGTPLDVDIISDHDIGEWIIALDPNVHLTPNCGITPSWKAAVRDTVGAGFMTEKHAPYLLSATAPGTPAIPARTAFALVHRFLLRAPPTSIYAIAPA
jgi:hypothetical protein